MKLLSYMKKLKEALVGEELRKTLRRNAEAADKLDRAVRELLSQ